MIQFVVMFFGIFLLIAWTVSYHSTRGAELVPIVRNILRWLSVTWIMVFLILLVASVGCAVVDWRC
jgi:hypothetical protein